MLARTLTVALMAAALSLVPAPAWARDQVRGTNPADGAVLSSAPAEVELHLSASPDLANSHITVWDPAGNTTNAGSLRQSGKDTLRQSVAVTSTGDFTMTYHVTFLDGKEVTGLTRFSVGTGVAPSGSPAAAVAEEEHEHGVDPVGAALIAIDVLVLGGAVVMLLITRRPRAKPAG